MDQNKKRYLISIWKILPNEIKKERIIKVIGNVEVSQKIKICYDNTLKWKAIYYAEHYLLIINNLKVDKVKEGEYIDYINRNYFSERSKPCTVKN